MVRRLISSSRSEIRKMSASDLKTSILASEGRTVLCQNFIGHTLCEGTTNAEVSQAFGADMIFFNGYSMDTSVIQEGLIVEEWNEATETFDTKQYRLKEMKKLINVPLGVYLECGAGDDATTSTAPEKQLIKNDRIASKENLEKAIQEECDFVVLAGNPGTRTSYQTIVEATRQAKAVVGDKMLLFAGKWEDGVFEKVLGDPQVPMSTHKQFVQELIDAGDDVICLPMPGCRPGITVEDIRELTTFTHTYKPGTLVMSFLDCSVEGADDDSIRQCTLWSKMTGADIHAIGDAGLSGMSSPEGIYTMSIALKGRRLTFRRLGAGGR
ncbi:hypothetical protein HCB46_05335 [Listeria ivanovii]|uniref:DUF7916 family protein n=1 Tax=Listeria ivanovii TaxID=1638 RepID=UPI00162743D6|nr:hypothetical protein [Listeria ivanovii]MBC2254889.1 hypothetical protein [Listeria ivanovii]